MKIAEWIGRLGQVWVEGQLSQINRRPGTSTAFLVLRDPSADMSISVTCHPELVRTAGLKDGDRVVVRAKPDFYPARGSLSLRAAEIRHLGIGELLLRLERLKRMLAAEGLFDRKRPIPFLPATIGLVTGRASAAERDVVDNARRRWPAVRFRIANVAVQGALAVPQIVEALRELDRDPDVDVIVVARGGGSVEDLLPFSDETLCRAVAACRTPVVSAIGHEPDSPLLDLVADLRCSTPTDAGKRIVPDVAEQRERVTQLAQRARRAVTQRVATESQRLAAIRSRPVLARPHTMVTARREEVVALRDRGRRHLRGALANAVTELGHHRARVAALSPAATLERGYAIVQHADGTVVRRTTDVAAAQPLRLRLIDGHVAVTVAADHPAHDTEQEVR